MENLEGVDVTGGLIAILVIFSGICYFGIPLLVEYLEGEKDGKN